MNKLNKEQLQAILDNYSVGRIQNVYSLAEVLIKEEDIKLSSYLVETGQACFMVALAKDDEIHDIWWSSNPKQLEARLSNPLKLDNAKMLLTNQNVTTVHKYDLRIVVFAL